MKVTSGWNDKKHLIKLLSIAAVFLVGFYLAKTVGDNTLTQQLADKYGYFGVLILATISGFNFVVPVPAIAFLPFFLEAGLKKWGVILIMTVGITIADSLAYYLGRTGRQVINSGKTEKFASFLKMVKEKYKYLPLIVLFAYVSIVPLPNELVVIPLALIGYTYRSVLPVLLIGNFFYNLLYSQGVIHLFEAL